MDALAEGYSSCGEMPDDVAAKLEAVSVDIDARSARRYAYEPQIVTKGGVFVVLRRLRGRSPTPIVLKENGLTSAQRMQRAAAWSRPAWR